MRAAPFVSLLVASGAVAAQCPESAGPFAGVPGAFMVHGSGALAPDQMYHKRAGLDGKAPGAWPGGLPPLRPDFDLQQLLRKCTRTPLEVDAISIGEDWVIGDCAGRAMVPPGRWAAVTLSLTRGTGGRRGSRIAAERAAGSSVEADIYSYVLPGSELAIPAALVGQTERAYDAAEVGLRGDVAGFDMFVPYHALDDRVGNTTVDPRGGGMMLAQTNIYFSLTSASAKLAPAQWFSSQTGPLPSGATILCVSWLPTAGIWTCPRVWRSYADLSLSDKEDIDGLGIDIDGQQMLFSTDIRIVPRDPLMFFSWAPGCRTAIPVPYTTSTGTPLSSTIGLIGVDDIDAICSMDPSVPRRSTLAGGRPNNAFYVHGTPQATTGLFRKPVLSAAAFREFDHSTGLLRFVSPLIGWPGNVANPGAAVLLVTPLASVVPFVQADAVVRNPANVLCGDPQAGTLQFAPVPAWYGATVMLRWFAGDATTVGEAWPHFVRL